MTPDTANEKLPMSGVRVLDLATMLAAPFCGTILGEFGAEVIKVELRGGNSSRSFGTVTATGSSFIWLSEQRNKKCITLDLRKPEGKALAEQLVAQSDIVVENFMPGTLERWGLGYERLKEIKPDIILVRVTAYGQTGPYIDRPGFARVAHAFAGLSNLAGESDGRPVIPGSTSLGDYITGLYAALGAMLSYVARERYGIGQQVDIGLYEGVFRMLDEMASVYAKTGFVRTRLGADTVNLVPHSHYECSDGKWVALACSNEEMWRRMATAMGREDMTHPDTYGHVSKRLAARDYINQVVGDFMRTKTRDEIISHCLSFEVPIGPLYDVSDIFKDPQYEARGNLHKVEVPKEGTVVMPGVIPKLSETPGRIKWAGPDIGAHNDEIYMGLLGLSREELDRLTQAGVI